MQVDIHWENQASNVIRVSCAGAWVWADMAQAIRNWHAIQIPPPQQVCIIVDMRAVTSIASDTVLHLKDAATSSRDVNGQIVVIMSSSAVAIVFKMFVTLYWKVGGKFCAASSEEEAYRLLGLIPEQSGKPRS